MTKEEHSVIGGNFEQGTAREIMETVVWNNTCDLADDRDYWKERAQALERAQHETSTCDTCLHVHKDFYEGPCKTCAKEKNWEFDQERFKG